MQIKSKILEKSIFCVHILLGLVCGVVLTNINKTVPFLKLSHYHTITLKKESNGICRIRNNIIYLIYNNYLPLYPLKMSIFRKV